MRYLKLTILLLPFLVFSQENNASLFSDGANDYVHTGTNGTTSAYNATWMGWFYFNNLTTQHTLFSQFSSSATDGYYINTAYRNPRLDGGTCWHSYNINNG